MAMLGHFFGVFSQDLKKETTYLLGSHKELISKLSKHQNFYK